MVYKEKTGFLLFRGADNISKQYSYHRSTFQYSRLFREIKINERN